MIPHQPQMNNTGYTMHGPTFFGNQLFHPHPGAILNVSSFCSFNSVTNFISWSVYKFNYTRNKFLLKQKDKLKKNNKSKQKNTPHF